MAIPNVPHATYDEFRAATIGHAYDIDGFPASQPYQCWDFVDLLYQQSDVGQYLYTDANVGGSDSGVKTCWTNTTARQLNGSGHFTAIADVTEIKKGDILVFNYYTGWYGTTGHIGFAEEDYNGSPYIQLLSQNYGGHYYVVSERAFLGLAFLGIFRYDAWANPTPPPPAGRRKSKFPWAIALEHWYKS